MNNNELRGTWDQIKGFGREIWGELSGNEQSFFAGQKQRLIGKLEARFGLSQEQAKHRVDETDQHD